MKKLTIAVAALTVCIGAAKAGLVSTNVAQKTAINYYGQATNKVASVSTLAYTETDALGNAVYYVFNINQQDGFVIVTAEDAARPIIGYSTNGQWVVPAKGTNVQYWMDRRKNEIENIRTNNIQATDDITAEWNTYINNTKLDKGTKKAMTAVGPLCQSTWDQQYTPYPYNYFCPPGLTGSISTTNQSVTGCVATTMAQIMRYWSYPAKGVGNHSYCDCSSQGYTENYGTLSANFAHTYNWSAMPLTPASTSKITTADTDIARLMYDCGVSVEMDYSPNGSGAFVLTSESGGGASAQNSYVQYFGYYANTIHGVKYPMKTEQAWIDTMEKEFNNSRIVQYEGDESAGGHTWVCDGNDATTPYNNVHMNWGWSGYDDGFFAVTNLTPSGQGTFNSNLAALIGIEPPPGKLTSVTNISNENSVVIYPNPSNGSFTIDMNSIQGKQQLVIYNMLGQNIYSTSINENKTQVNLNQASGVYFYRILSLEGNITAEGKLLVK